jgi:hypothetical protein
VATTTQLVAAKKSAGPLALWHLLSLDAPTIAALWTWFVAHANHIRLPLASPAAMALAVWMLYAADRLLDARLLDTQPLLHNELEARHLFHHRHRRAFLLGIAFAAIALAALLPRIDAAAIHLYLTEGALLFAWFLILHATRSAHRLPKEIAVGLFFAAAIFIPTVSRNPGLRLELLPVAILFATLCGLNCLFIYAWEHDSTAPANTRQAHATTRLALRHLPALAVSAAIADIAIALLDPASPRSIAIACALSTVLLLALDRTRRRFREVTLRAAADLVLLTPLALLPFIR